MGSGIKDNQIILNIIESEVKWKTIPEVIRLGIQTIINITELEFYKLHTFFKVTTVSQYVMPPIFYLLHFSRKLKYNYIARKPQHWRLICHFSI